jgi:spermidine/putrescine transport system ATP-binding protein
VTATLAAASQAAAVQAASTPAIELVEATKRYGDALALDRASMAIEPGEFFCLLGPSGCGKTTTLNLIGGFVPLTSGELRIEGRQVNDLPPHRRNVNTVFQNYALFPHLTVADNVAFGLRMEGLPDSEVRSRVGEYLELVGLSGYGPRMPTQLSGGQQQRIALARALVKRPAVLLLDEPLGALDLKLRKQMQIELSRIHRQVGTTFVLVTHDQGEALSMATRIAVMDRGVIRQIGSPRDIYYRPADRFVADFIGETNFLDGELSADGSTIHLGDGLTVRVPPDAVARGVTSLAVTLLVRPECVDVGLTAPDGLEAIGGRVVDVSFLGDHTRLTVSTAVGQVVAVRPHSDRSRSAALDGLLEQEVSVWWSAADSAVIARES